jgi:TRAP-type uncharacterized transport system substrate-binding protein
MPGIDPNIAHRRFVWAMSLVAIAIFAAAVWAAFVLLEPTPPRTVVMSTGSPGSAYVEFGERYREILAREGIELRLLSSAGAIENLERLRDLDAGVSVGFVQGGTITPDQASDLASLGTIAYEPLWFFYRDVDVSRGLEGFRGRRISIGQRGSGSRELAVELLARNGVERSSAEWFAYPPQEAAKKLAAGEIEAAIMVAPWEATVVQRLLSADGVGLVSFPRADAYVALYPYLDKLVLPAGVADLAKNRPPADVLLLAPKASLAVRRDLHPAIQYLLLDAAANIHSGPGIFQKAGQFPAAESIDLPLSDNARQYFKSGRPFLQRYLPFWLAVMVGQILVLLIPLAGVLYPMMRLAPNVYAFLMRRRIFRLYTELKHFEVDLDRRGTQGGVADLAERLDQLEDRANRVRMPAAYANMLYTLRLHIGLVRSRFEKLRRLSAEGRSGT